MAKETLHWDRPFHTVRSGSFENGDIVWFPEGGLNASYNCVDRWAYKHPDKVRGPAPPPSPHSPSPIISLPLPRAISPRACALRPHSLRNAFSAQYMRWHWPINARLPCLRDNPGRRRVARRCKGHACYLSRSPAFPAAVGSRVARLPRQARSHARQIARMRHRRPGENASSCPRARFPDKAIRSRSPSLPRDASRRPPCGLVPSTLTDLGVHRRRSSTRPTSPTRAPTSPTPSSCARCAPSRTCSSRGA